MSDWYILKDKKAVPASSIEEAAIFMNNAEARKVGYDEVSPNVYVSTVFLGIDHNWGEGKPLLFETLVFGGVFDEKMDRYETWEEAETGHKKVVELVKKSVGLFEKGEMTKEQVQEKLLEYKGEVLKVFE